MRKYSSVLLILLLLQGITAAQTKTNLDIFYELIDSSIAILPSELPVKGNNLFLNTGSNSLLYNYIFGKLINRYPGISAADSNFKLSFALEKTSLSYGDIFRKNFLGDYYIQRDVSISGNYVVPASGTRREFVFTSIDTVMLENVRSLENSLHPFTRGEIPTEPVLPGIIEPVIAIGTAATAVILFFILRSK